MTEQARTLPQTCSLTDDESCETGWRRHFAHPTGWLGALTGHLMALKNRERGEWIASLLGARGTDRLLEIGFGPGVDVARVAGLATQGHVAGVDPSDVMLRQAQRRNAAAIASGRVELRLGEATALPYPDASFDCVFSTNTVQFWGDLDAGLAEARRVLVPGGRLLVAIQPRSAGATADTTGAWERRLADALAGAGFEKIEPQQRPMRPVPVVAVRGRKPAR